MADSEDHFITNGGQTHVISRSHNSNWERAKYLLSLFDDGTSTCEQADALIIEFANEHPDFRIHCYIACVFNATVDAFMLSAIFNKWHTLDALLLDPINQRKLDVEYAYGLGCKLTPREAISWKEPDKSTIEAT